MFGKLLPVVCALSIVTFHHAKAWDAVPTAGAVLGQFVEILKAQRSAVFFSGCQVNDHIKAVLIFQPTEEVGGFLVISDRAPNGEAFAFRHGQVAFRDGFATLIDSNVTSYDLETYEQLVSILLTSPFHILAADRLDEIYAEPVQQTC